MKKVNKKEKKKFVIEGKMNFPPEITVSHRGELGEKPKVSFIKFSNLYTKCDDFVHLGRVRVTIEKLS